MAACARSASRRCGPRDAVVFCLPERQGRRHWIQERLSLRQRYYQAAIERVTHGVGHQGEDVVDGDLAAQLSVQGRDTGVGDAARHNRAERVEVAVTVEGKAVQGG